VKIGEHELFALNMTFCWTKICFPLFWYFI